MKLGELRGFAQMKRIPKIEIFLTFALVLFSLALSPLASVCCKESSISTKASRSCCPPQNCCCKPDKAPVKQKQSLASTNIERREFSPPSAGLAATAMAGKVDAAFESRQCLNSHTQAPTRSKLFLLYRSLLI